MIVVFHFDTTFPYVNRLGLTPGWYIAVEFFFIVSGYLLYKKVQGSGGSISPWRYTLHRYKQIYPKYLISVLITFIAIVIARKLSPVESVDLLLDSYWELLGLQGIGLAGDGIISIRSAGTSPCCLSRDLFSGFSCRDIRGLS